MKLEPPCGSSSSPLPLLSQLTRQVSVSPDGTRLSSWRQECSLSDLKAAVRHDEALCNLQICSDSAACGGSAALLETEAAEGLISDPRSAPRWSPAVTPDPHCRDTPGERGGGEAFVRSAPLWLCSPHREETLHDVTLCLVCMFSDFSLSCCHVHFYFVVTVPSRFRSFTSCPGVSTSSCLAPDRLHVSTRVPCPRV